MEPQTKKTIGWIAGGCGCLTMLVLTAWLGFAFWIGLDVRGRDREGLYVMASATCCVMLPVLAITIAGLFFALKKIPHD